jgi:hypothetical protein
MNKLIIVISVLLMSITQLQAEPTKVKVTVLAKDAKFIGSSMDGAQITILNSDTAEVLAQGLTEGATGDTKTIMQTPHSRHQVLSSDNSASYQTTLNITKPIKIKVTARGPMNLDDNSSTVSAEYWLIPGKHLDKNDAIKLEMPGFFIKSSLTHDKNSSMIAVTSEIRMMCGCPIEPDGLWDANRYEIVAYLLKNGEEVARKTMDFVKTSEFSTEFKLSDKGNYQIVTFAYDPHNSNTGVDTLSFTH